MAARPADVRDAVVERVRRSAVPVVVGLVGGAAILVALKVLVYVVMMTLAWR